MDIITWADSNTLMQFAASRTPELTSFFLMVTQYSSTPAMSITIGCIALFLILPRRRAELIGFATTVVSSTAVMLFLKDTIQRPRPDRVYAAISETGYSFPSGHALFAVAVYGFLIFLTARSRMSEKVRAVCIGFLIAIILAVGFSRLYLGVHYFSDVLAGYFIGWILLNVGVSIAKSAKQHF